MNTALPKRGLPRQLAGLLACAAAVAIVTASIFALDSFAPVLSLGVLYVFAVLPVAVLFGPVYALLVSVASMLAFNWFFLEPTHTFQLRDGENWIALAVYLVTALVVSALAARSRAREAEAERRALEASLLAGVAGSLLESDHVQDELRGISDRVAEALGVERARIELDSVRRPEPGESALELSAGERRVGRMFVESEPDAETAKRVSTSLASLLAVALDRERLGRRAVEAEALRRSDAIKTAILRAVSHDLRSPLTAIRTATDGLESTALELSESDRADLLATIDVETRRLDHLVANLLDLSRLELGAAEPRPELWTVESLVGQALNELGARAERVDVALAAGPPADRGRRRPDRARARQPDRQRAQVLAGRAGRARRRAAERRSGRPRRRPRAGPRATPSSSASSSRSSRDASPSRGSGLGLAIAKGFAQANGARLEAEPARNGGAASSSRSRSQR